MSNKKLYWSSSDFSDFFMNNITEDKLPRVNWGGFNMCITPIDFLDAYLCVVRIHLTPSMYTNKIVPGIYPHKKFLEEIKDNNNFSKNDFSKTFMWNNWSGDDYAIYFISKIKYGKLVPDTSFKPMVAMNMRSKIQPIPRPTKPPFPAWIQNPYVTSSDFRVAELDNKPITYDAYLSSISEILIFNKTKQISQKPLINSLCIPKDDSYPSEWNPVKDNEPYTKYFDKNWSIVGRLPSVIDKEKRILFLDWFYDSGIWGILGDNNGFCNRIQLIKFNGEKMHSEPTESIPGFSFGSTLMDISNLTKLKIDKIGIGHIKLDYLGNPINNKFNKAFKHIQNILEENFGENNFILHYKYAYAAFFYRIFYKDGWNMHISSAWFPILTSAKDMYHSLIYFPMSITRNLNNKSTALISGGYTDYHNILLEFPLDVIIESCNIDTDNFKLDDFDINPIRIESKS